MSEEGTVKIHKMIGSKLYPLELKRNRFEQTMDRIDHAVQYGASHKDILQKFSMHIVSKGSPVADPADSIGKKSSKPSVPQDKTTNGKIDKQVIIAQTMKEFPHMSVGEIARKVSAHGHMTYANASYIAKKLIK